MLTATDLHIRDAGPGDAEACGRIFYDAFVAIAHRHAFPVEPDSPEFTAFQYGKCGSPVQNRAWIVA